MKLISLSQGKFAMVDDEDFDRINQWKWCLRKPSGLFYAERKNKERKTLLMHRIILNVNDPLIFVDHKDGNGLNNQKENMRLCSALQNNRNRKKQKNCLSKFKGVTYEKKINKQGRIYEYWKTSIRVNGKPTTLGCFPYNPEGEIAAAKRYDMAAKVYFGEFAYLNFK